MSLDVYIKFKKPRQVNYYLEHPYIYNNLSERDLSNYSETDQWSANITHNVGEIASHVPVDFNGWQTTLYMACWRPEVIGVKTVADILPLLIQGIHFMVDNRKDLELFNPENGWGSYNGFMKFLLNYKQACEDAEPDCLIGTSR